MRRWMRGWEESRGGERGAELYVVTSNGSSGCNTIVERMVQPIVTYGLGCSLMTDVMWYDVTWCDVTILHITFNLLLFYLILSTLILSWLLLAPLKTSSSFPHPLPPLIFSSSYPFSPFLLPLLIFPSLTRLVTVLVHLQWATNTCWARRR